MIHSFARPAAAVLVLFAMAAAQAQFTFEDDGNGVTLHEGDSSVFRYNYTMLAPPDGVNPERFTRSCYIHPLWGLDGEELTQDFPSDHYHHRGVFFGWPVVRVGERQGNNWELHGLRMHFGEFKAKDASADRAQLVVRNEWRFDGEDDAIAEETATVTVYPATEVGRYVDFRIEVRNISDEEMFIAGSQSMDRPLGVVKGYGGLNYRPDATRRPRAITVAEGPLERDALTVDSPWADYSSANREDPDNWAGVAIFQHPDNPDFPHDGWILRHYGFLGASWPHAEGTTIEPGDSFTLEYRLYVHRGNAEDAQVAQAFEAFVQTASGATE